MKLLKNNLKLFIGVLIGAILTGGIVYAAVSASEVNYTTDKNANIETVAAALNDLYSRKKNLNIISVYSGDSMEEHMIDISKIYENYKELTIDNFFIKNATMKWQTGDTARSVFPNIISSYDVNTGILNLNSISARNNGYDYYINYEVVLVY